MARNRSCGKAHFALTSELAVLIKRSNLSRCGSRRLCPIINPGLPGGTAAGPPCEIGARQPPTRRSAKSQSVAVLPIEASGGLQRHSATAKQ
jgi:hypothetical protein